MGLSLHDAELTKEVWADVKILDESRIARLKQG
jgi:hypothetical protein